MRRPLLAIALALGMLSVPSTASAKVVFGMHTPGDPFAGNTKKIDGLQHDLRRRIGVVSWFQNWGGEQWVTGVQPKTFAAVRDKGRRSMVTWEPWQPNGGAWQPQYSLARIAGGAFDGYISAWAQGLKAQRQVVYLRPMHEMNGNWYPWGGTVNGNSPELFRAAWRRMHTIFRQNGANNVRWVFSPVNEDYPMTRANRFERYYPGRRFVDVLALDGYNWGARRPEFGGWRSFRKTFRGSYRRITRLGNQPVWIAEVGSATVGGNKARWVRDMWRQTRRMKRLKGLVWMNTVSASEGDWRARSPFSVAAAFSARR